MARKATPDIRPFTRQFYRGTKRYLVLGLIQTVIITAANLLISWLLQQMLTARWHIWQRWKRSRRSAASTTMWL